MTDGQTDRQKVRHMTCLSEGWDLGGSKLAVGGYDERAIAHVPRDRGAGGPTSGWKLLESSTNLARSQIWIGPF